MSGYEVDMDIQDIDRRIVNSELFKAGIKYHVEPLKFWFCIPSNYEESSPEQLGVSEEHYLYASFLLSSIQECNFKSRLLLSIKKCLLNDNKWNIYR